ncbi:MULTISPECIES: lytic polysaccharide monooxygenase [Pseudomonas]|uniref:Lytic polysaccharide monooxygenase n=1 Tax=Pseudomonas vlassakiae TaxID=485888 RepID=A0A923GFD5_9PSED|nr:MULTISPECIES: lytic polysaccharide monooxygenase [Pseudomonas]MBH3409597.1 lytic polysaccharide monooxygenase [Pseudomonas putida]MBV4543315.1 lytic polysaccharide monooxygenase [Pseudomonas vlassakiae]
MRMLLQTSLACLIAAAAVQANAAGPQPRHGAMETPVARQLFCYKAQDYYWPEDGSGIKDPGCRAAYQHVYKKFGNDKAQAEYQFVQWSEVSKNIPEPGYEDFKNVKAAIPDGQLCSAGNSVAKPAALKPHQTVNDKSGLDVPAQWPAHLLVKDNDNKVELVYYAQVPHSPGFWEIYITKPGFDRTKKALAWDDLEAEPIAKFGDIPVEGGKYQMVVDLGDRVGDYLIYSRWQRIDPEGEGFYNCSDVNIVSSK